MPVFLTLGLIGFGLLLVSLLFDSDHDYSHGDVGHDSDGDHSGPGVLNLKVIASFLAAFGAGGAIARQYQFGMVESSLIGLVSGAILAVVVYFILGWVYSLQGSSHATTSEVVGQMAMVSVGISPGQVGEVMLTMKGSQYSYPARAVTDIILKEGDIVRVRNFYAETAIVEPVSVSSRIN